jgi:hypothetical protein
MYFDKKFSEWMKYKNETKIQLANLANKLDELHSHSMKAKIAGMSVGVIGSATSLVGVLLAPTTFGLSVSLTIGGTAVAAIGSLTTIVSTFKEDILSKSICKEAENLIRKEVTEARSTLKLMSKSNFRRKMESHFSSLIGKCAQESMNITSLVSNVNAAKQAGDIANASKILLNQSKSFKIFGVGMLFFFLAFDLVELVETLIEMKEEPCSPFSEQIKTIYRSLEAEFNVIEYLIEENIGYKKSIE